MDSQIINIARDFSRFPAGRFYDDGDFSGQRFREKFLVPALSKPGAVTVELHGTAGYGSSFLEEAFGGLIRIEGFKATELHTRLLLVSKEDESLIEEIWQYIDNAK